MGLEPPDFEKYRKYEEELAQIVSVKEGHIVVNVHYEYNIPLTTCNTYEKNIELGVPADGKDLDVNGYPSPVHRCCMQRGRLANSTLVVCTLTVRSTGRSPATRARAGYLKR